ncbi:hypothetical protein [Streptomyces sp. NPDC012888]|uniref:hypothetical protein n=1 Tax=Streptomyces sp. NPDC012888 TaxID=3364855 RepID=UPI0036BAC9B0
MTIGRIVAGGAGAVGLGLVGIVVLVDLDTGDRVASVLGALVTLGLAAYTFLAPAGLARQIRAGRGATVIAGTVTGSALGTGSTVAGAPTQPRPPLTEPDADGTPRAAGEDVRAARDATVVLGDVHDSALGDGSERR